MQTDMFGNRFTEDPEELANEIVDRLNKLEQSFFFPKRIVNLSFGWLTIEDMRKQKSLVKFWLDPEKPADVTPIERIVVQTENRSSEVFLESLKDFDKNAISAISRVLAHMDIEINKHIQRKKIIHFDNADIVITDPCYIVPKDGDKRDDWGNCYSCETEIVDLSIMGLKNYIVSETLEGDWYRDVIDTRTKQEIGGFCADSGTVAVMDLKEILDYNPDFLNRVEEDSHSIAVIKNFTGDVSFKITPVKRNIKRIEKCHPWEPMFKLSVIGKGSVNFKTKECL